jgi:hypothetical protein
MPGFIERFLMRIVKQDECCMVDHEAAEVEVPIPGRMLNRAAYEESLEDEIYEYADHLAEDTGKLYEVDELEAMLRPTDAFGQKLEVGDKILVFGEFGFSQQYVHSFGVERVYYVHTNPLTFPSGCFLRKDGYSVAFNGRVGRVVKLNEFFKEMP